MTRTCVYVTARFEAWHRWIDAPEDVAFLRDFHRHLFHVKMSVEVGHQNRDIEFIQLKQKLCSYLNTQFTGRHMELSCEQMAQQILTAFGAKTVDVSEDGENGAVVLQLEPVTDPVKLKEWGGQIQ